MEVTRVLWQDLFFCSPAVDLRYCFHLIAPASIITAHSWRFHGLRVLLRGVGYLIAWAEHYFTIFCTLNDIYVSRPRLNYEASSVYISFPNDTH
jgi:hypothetical protein